MGRRMNTLCEGASSFLEQTYRDDIASFPFTTSVRAGKYESEYTHARTIRSTINCLLGMQEARKHHPSHPFLQRVEEMTERFLSLHETNVTDLGDLGLLLALLSEGGAELADARRVLSQLIERTSDESRLRRLNIQDLTWLLWGSVSASRRGLVEAEPVAHMLFKVMRASHHHRGEALPRHDAHRTRGPIISFGASVYYVNVAYKYGRAFDSQPAMGVFRQGVTALLACQRAGGEWPWLLNCGDGRPLDVYPVFSVHQHSMAMFFLFPAQSEGFADAEQAISRSMSWMSGTNQLGAPMVCRSPFFTYRSIERKARWPRAQRYLRARRVVATKEVAMLAPNSRVVINPETRSYELGWALYLLSAKPALTGLD